MFFYIIFGSSKCHNTIRDSREDLNTTSYLFTYTVLIFALSTSTGTNHYSYTKTYAIGSCSHTSPPLHPRTRLLPTPWWQLPSRDQDEHPMSPRWSAPTHLHNYIYRGNPVAMQHKAEENAAQAIRMHSPQYPETTWPHKTGPSRIVAAQNGETTSPGPPERITRHEYWKNIELLSALHHYIIETNFRHRIA